MGGVKRGRGGGGGGSRTRRGKEVHGRRREGERAQGEVEGEGLRGDVEGDKHGLWGTLEEMRMYEKRAGGGRTQGGL